MTGQMHIVLVHQPERQDIQDFFDIADAVHRKARDIRVFVVNNESINAVSRRKAAEHPSIIVSPGPLDVFRPQRGTIFAGNPLRKMEQMGRLQAGGLPVPPFGLALPKTAEEMEVFRPYVLAKSNALHISNGSGISLHKADDLFQPNDLSPQGEIYFQKLIITGEFAEVYRVFTFFGRPVLAYLKTSVLPGPTEFTIDQDPSTLCFQPRSKTGQTHRLAFDIDVLKVASQIYDVFPEIPLHGIDIVREKSTGKLFVLEINPGGNTWVFSKGGFNQQRLMQALGVSDLRAPFDAFNVCAEALIKIARSRAS